MAQRRSILSTEFVVIPVDIVIPELTSFDPLADVVQFNFVNGGLPKRIEPGDDANMPQWTGWLNGAWVTFGTGGMAAVILTGPAEGAAVNLPKAKWAIWVKVIDNPSVPVVAVDTLTVD